MFTTPNPFSIITGRARRLLDQIESKLQQGQISTQVGFLTEILAAVGKFTRGLREPSMVVPVMQADDLLIREFVAEPIADAAEDVTLAFSQVKLLQDLTRQLFNVVQAEQAGLSENLAEATAELDQLRLWISDSDKNFVWAGDTFNHSNRVSPASTIFLDTVGGTVTLHPNSSRSLSDRIVSATIDRKLSAGGLPGNNLEIRLPGQAAFTGATPEPLPVLYDQPPRDAIPAIWDGNPDTWFEWERNYIDPSQPVVLAGQAFIYDPSGKSNYITNHKKILGFIHENTGRGGLSIPALPNWNAFVRWPGDLQIDTGVADKGYPLAYFDTGDRQDLRLALAIVLDQPYTISWLTLTPLIKGSAYPEVEQILISSDGQRFRNLLSTPTVLHPRMNKGIDFSQYGDSASNFEGVGVWPFPATPISVIKIVLRQASVYETPLGMGHRFTMDAKKHVRSQGPIATVGSFASTVADASSPDFAQNEVETQQSLLEGFDVLKGQRQAIALRDLLIEQRTYDATSQLLSQPFVLDRAVKSAALLTTEKIPEDWPAARPDGSPWIAYEVSPDGNIWKPIVPQTTQLTDSVVPFDLPTTTVSFRATFSRPDASPTESPLLLVYALKMLPA